MPQMAIGYRIQSCTQCNCPGSLKNPADYPGQKPGYNKNQSYECKNNKCGSESLAIMKNNTSLIRHNHSLNILYRHKHRTTFIAVNKYMKRALLKKDV